MIQKWWGLRHRTTGWLLASNPDPALGQLYAETQDPNEACAWTTEFQAQQNLGYLDWFDGAWDVVPLDRGVDETLGDPEE